MTVAGTKLMKDFIAMKTLASSRVPADSLLQVCTQKGEQKEVEAIRYRVTLAAPYHMGFLAGVAGRRQISPEQCAMKLYSLQTLFSTCFASRSSSVGSLFYCFHCCFISLHVTVTCAGRHMELGPSAKQIGWVLRNQNGLSRPSSFWTSSSSAAKRWCLPWGSRSRHEHWAPEWVFLWKVDRGTPYWSWLWDILAFLGNRTESCQFSF